MDSSCPPLVEVLDCSWQRHSSSKTTTWGRQQDRKADELGKDTRSDDRKDGSTDRTADDGAHEGTDKLTHSRHCN